MTTMAVWCTVNAPSATSPMKWRLRAACLPPKIRVYHGNRPATAGDIATPVRICSGAMTRITEA